MTETAPRKAIERPVELFLDGLDQEVPVLGVSVNVSDTGMLVLSERVAARGAMIHFAFAEFSGGAEVVWSQPAPEREGEMFLGLRFVDLDPEARSALHEMLETAARLYRPTERPGDG